jgi:uncharacterized damage-inducible protein DinB
MMKLREFFLSLLETEAPKTRTMLSCVPLEHADWKPHEKSAPLLKLAKHIARIPGWSSIVLAHDEIDYDANPFVPYPEVKSIRDLLGFYDRIVVHAQHALKMAPEQEFAKPFTLRRGEQFYATLSKGDVIMSRDFNHTIHHRGQLSVYLRLLNIPVPGMYGQSADEPMHV